MYVCMYVCVKMYACKNDRHFMEINNEIADDNCDITHNIYIDGILPWSTNLLTVHK